MKYSEFKKILLENGFSISREGGKFHFWYDNNDTFPLTILIAKDNIDCSIDFSNKYPHEYIAAMDIEIFNGAYSVDVKFNSKFYLDWHTPESTIPLPKKSNNTYDEIINIINYIKNDLINDIEKEIERISKVSSVNKNSSIEDIMAYIANKHDDISFTNSNESGIYLSVRQQDKKFLVGVLIHNKFDIDYKNKLADIIQRIFHEKSSVTILNKFVHIMWEAKDIQSMINYINIVENKKSVEEFLKLFEDMLSQFDEGEYDED